MCDLAGLQVVAKMNHLAVSKVEGVTSYLHCSQSYEDGILALHFPAGSFLPHASSSSLTMLVVVGSLFKILGATYTSVIINFLKR